MKSPKSRRFRPSLDALEPIRLLACSCGLNPPPTVDAQAVVNLKPTPVGADALHALSDAAPRTGRQRIVLNSLTADDATGQVKGRATGFYSISSLGSLTVTISFKTSYERPRARDVKVRASRFDSFFGDEKVKVQRAVVRFLRDDRDEIRAALQG